MSDSLEFRLTVDSRDFEIKLSNAGKLISTFGSRAESGARNAKKLDSSILGIAGSAQQSIVVLGMLGNAIHTLKASFVDWQATILNTAGKLERMQVMLRGMATESDKAGQAQREMNQLLDMARHAPFSLDALSNSYVKLRTTGIEPAKDTLQAMTDAVARFGGDDELLKRATIAIQQMAGKGVVSMEELRQQLGEAVPSAMRKMAYSMGVSVAQLAKMVSTGTVEANAAIKGMMTELQMANMNAAENLMVTWDGMLSKMRTNAMVLAETIAKSGYMDTMKGVVQDITDLMASQQAEAWARGFGAAIKELVEYLRAALSWINNNSAALKSMGENLLMVWAASKVFSTIAGLMAMVTRAAGVLQAAFTSIGTALAVFRTVQGLLGTFPALFAVITRAFLAMTAAMSVNPLVAALTLAAGAAYVLWEWFGRIEKKALDAAAAIKKVPDAMTDTDMANMRAQLGEYLKDLDKLYAKRNRTAEQGKANPYSKAQRDSKLKELNEDIRELEAKRDELVSALQVGTAAREASGLDKRLQQEAKTVSERTTELSRVYEEQSVELEKKIAELEKRTDLDPKAKQAQLDEIRAQQKEFAEAMANGTLEAQQAFYNGVVTERKRLENELKDPALTQALKTQFEKQVEVLIAYEKRWAETLQSTRFNLENLKNMYNGLHYIGAGGEKDSFLTSLRNQADSAVESLAGASAKIDEAGSNLAKAKAKFQNDLRNAGYKSEDSLSSEQLEQRDRWFNAEAEKDKIEAAKLAQQKARQAAVDAKRTAAEIKRNYQEMERAIDAGDRLTDMVSFSGTAMAKFDKDLRNTTEGLEKLVEASKTAEGQKYIDPQSAAEAERMLTILRDRAAEYRQELQKDTTDQLITKWAPHSEEIIQGAKRSSAVVRAEFNKNADESIANLKRMIEANKDNVEVRLQLEDQLNQTLAARHSAFVQTVGTQAEQLAEAYKDVASQIDDAVSGAFENLTDQLMDFCETGKFNFADFGNFIFKEMQRIFIQSQVVAPLMSGLGIGTNAMTGSGIMDGMSSAWNALTGGPSGGGDSVAADAAASAMGDVAKAAGDTTAAMGDLQQKGIFASITAFGQQVWAWITGSTVKQAENAATVAGTTSSTSFAGSLVVSTMALEAFTTALLQAAVTSTSTAAFANGGIMSAAGQVPLKMYAKGGIANSPQLALFGEGSMNEAYVPLPDGRSIPVSFKDAPGRGGSGTAGGAEGGVQINIDVLYQGGEVKENTDEQGDARKWAEMAQRVKVIVLSTMAEEKRNGGMLSEA